MRSKPKGIDEITQTKYQATCLYPGNAAKQTTMTAEQVRALLQYDAETGHFRWVIPRSGSRRNRPCGTSHSGGYIVVSDFVDWHEHSIVSSY